MALLRRVVLRLRSVFAFARLQREMDEEMRSHIEQSVDRLINRGMTPSEALISARAEFGNRTVISSDAREARGGRWAESLVTDLRLAARALRRQPTWTTVAILTFALGIGATSALFTVVNAVLLRPLPYAYADRIVAPSLSLNGKDLQVVPNDVFVAWQTEATSLTAAAVDLPDQLVDVQGDVPTLFSGHKVTASYFDLLGVAPEAGRVFTAAEDVKNGPEIVLSDQLWRSRFGADRSILGKTITFGDKQTTVIGVMPPSFSRSRNAMYWMPAGVERTNPRGITFYYPVIGRLRDGTTIASAKAELSAIASRVVAARPGGRGSPAGQPTAYEPVVLTLHDRLFGSAKPALVLLFASVCVLLLIACANVTNLLLARATRRAPEFAIRSALGATQARLIQYLLCESLMISVVGGAIGLLVPFIAMGPLLRLSPAVVANVEHVRVDGTVLGAIAAVMVATAGVFALVPALNTQRTTASSLASGGSRLTGDAKQHRVRKAIVVAELATALVLLTGAALLGSSFIRATSIDPGFRPESLFVVGVSLPRTRYTTERGSQFFKTLLDRSRGLNGVRSAALTDLTPLSGVPFSATWTSEDGQVVSFDGADVGPGYFETIGLPIKQGRALNLADPSATHEVVISETMARTVFAAKNPIGQHISAGADTLTVVGVAPDVHQRGLEQASPSLAYRPLADTGAAGIGTHGTLLVRTSGSTAPVDAAMRAIVHQLDPRLLPPRMLAVDDIIAEGAVPRKFNAFVLGSLAALAAALATIGLYGVLAYVVSDRTHEIGVRIALGAERKRVLALVMGQGAALIATGVGLGFIGSVAAVRALRGLVFGIDIYDPTAFVSTAALLVGVAVLACYIPATRATRVDPMLALRAD